MMPYANEHAARMNEPGQYKIFARKEIEPGISLILGKKSKKDSFETQAVRFAASKFSAKEARDWLDKHDMKKALLKFEAAKKPSRSKVDEKTSKWLKDKYASKR